MQKLFKNITILFIGLMLSGITSHASVQYFNSYKKGNQIAPGVSFELRDDYWNEISGGSWSSLFGHGNVKNRIKLHFTGQKNQNHSTDATDKDWKVTVNLDYTYYTATAPTTAVTVSNKTLEIKYDPVAATYTDIDYLEFEDAHRVKVTINSVTLNDAASVPLDVYLEQEMEVERYFIFDYTDIPTLTVDGTAPFQKQVTLYWNYIYGAEEYDLEWCHITDYTIDPVTFSNIDDLQFTRVSVSGHNYTLNLAYDDGTIFFRIRAVGRHGSVYEDRLEGDWSTSVVSISVDNLMKNVTVPSKEIKNWTYQAYYAEEGKRKEVLSVFDGSGRNRQAITLNNSDNKALVAETFYDHEGRAIISTLPAVDEGFALNHQLKFYEGFSLTNESTPTLFRKRYYDRDDNSVACNPENDIKMSSDNGASHYYSADNNDAQGSGAGDYIADAELFPFTRTIMGRDGRVKYQSGVGAAHAIGNTHEQRYYYASPQQEKLDRLFGNHAGFAKHYQVTLVEDANGQVSMSYTNLAGQVVATSLIGETPESLTALESNSGPQTLTTSFDNNNQFIESENAWVIGKNIMIESIGEHNFEYTLKGEVYEGMCGSTGDDCVYDVIITIWNECEIVMTDEDGDVLDVSGNPDPVMQQTYTFDYTQLINGPTISFTINFPTIGTYYLEKKVTLNQAALNTALTNFETHLRDDELNTCFDYEQLDIDYSGCEPCSTYCATHDCPEGECDDLVDTENLASMSCEYLYNVLVADMSPGGQYFDNTPSGDLVQDNGWLNGWVLDETNGGDQTIMANTYGGNDTWDEVRANWTSTWLTTNFNGGAQTVNGRTCDNLLETHPEYCHYETCVLLRDQGITEFMYDLLEVEDKATAITKGWLGTTSPIGEPLVNATTGIDDLITYTSGFGTTFSDYMLNITDGIVSKGYSGSSTLWDEAVAAVNTTFPACSTSSTFCDDANWRMFRGMYLSARHTYINTYIECNFLCDEDIIPDNVADDCSLHITSTPAEAIGFEIRHPYLDFEEYDETTEQDDFEDAAGEAQMDCYYYTTIDASDLIQSPCTYNEGYITLDDYPTDITISDPFEPCAAADCFEAAQMFADAINNYISFPDFIAIVNGCEVEIRANAPTTYYVTSDVFFRDPIAHTNTQLGPKIFRTCVTQEDIPNCFCTDLNLNYVIYSDLYGAAVFDSLAEHYNDVYATSVTAADVEDWYDNCASINAPCSSGVACSLPEVIEDANCEPQEPECSPDEESEALSDFYSNAIFEELVAEKLDEFKAAYIEKCLHGANYSEHFTMTGEDHEYHYTLYFYDQAGNLTTTVPPAGVNLITGSQLTAVNEHRLNPTDYTKPFIHTSHLMQSGYRYNSYNLVLDQYMPDAENTFAFDILNPTNYSSPSGAGTLQGDAFMFDQNNGIAISFTSPNFSLVETMDGGQTWSAVSGFTPISNQLNAITFISPSEGYVIGAAGKAFHLTNYSPGTSITSTQFGATQFGSTVLNSIVFTDSNSGYIVGNGQKFFKTDAAGNVTDASSILTGSYNLFAIQKSGNLNSSATLFISGSGGYIAKITNLSTILSATVEEAQSNSTFTGRTIAVKDLETIIVGGVTGTTGEIYEIDLTNLPTSYGYNSAVDPANSNIAITSQSINNLLINENGTGYAVATSVAPTYASGTILITNDFGTTWFDETPASTNGVFFVNQSEGGDVLITGNDFVLFANTSDYSQRFFYDDLGRIKASQDARQSTYATPGYSYSVYDGQGRVKESGEIYSSDDPSRTELNDEGPTTPWPISFISTATRNQVTYVQYDGGTGIGSQFSNGSQDNLRSRVASTWYKEISTGNTIAATHYSYDIHGNVKEMVQENKLLENFGQSFKRSEYDYDLISGNIKSIAYQRGEYDEFYHRYYYDADNRLHEVETSKDSVIWDTDAKYWYYLHGPIARIEIGDKQVQGMDYSYTIQGWLKGINANKLDPYKEMGRDGFHRDSLPSSPPVNPDYSYLHAHFGRDAFGSTIGYFDGDYDAIGSYGNDFLTDIDDLNSGNAGNSLFNGNIRHVSNAIMDETQTPIPRAVNIYNYDQLNRIKEANTWLTTTTFASATNNDDYKEAFSYDANGNILSLLRNGVTSTQQSMDDMSYNYYLNTNKLEYVTDAVSASPYGDDIETQGAANFVYDEIGQLIHDEIEEIETIEWTLQHKVSKVTRETGSTKVDLEMLYDATGNLLTKIVKPKDGGGDMLPQEDWIYTFFSRNIQGNIAAVYEMTFEEAFGAGSYYANLKLVEQDVYGLKRLGAMEQDIEKQPFFTASTTVNGSGETVFDDISGFVLPDYEAEHLSTGQASRIVGQRTYELSNHLMSVIVTVSDKKLPVDDNNDDTIDYYLPNVVSWGDNYVYGSPQPDRFGGANSTNGFNGMRKIDEIYGEKNAYDFGARIQDPRLGRWLSVDKLHSKHADVSPYCFARNSPIIFMDFDGNDVLIAFTGGFQGEGKEIKTADAGTTGKIVEAVQGAATGEFDAIVITPGYTSGSSVTTAMDFVTKNVKAGEKIVVYGYSYGGDFAVEFAKELLSKGYQVDLLVTVDAADGPMMGMTVDRTIPSNVDLNENYYQTNGSIIMSEGYENAASDESATTVHNTDVTNLVENVTHGNMDEITMDVSIGHIFDALGIQNKTRALQPGSGDNTASWQNDSGGMMGTVAGSGSAGSLLGSGASAGSMVGSGAAASAKSGQSSRNSSSNDSDESSSSKKEK
jgi:RHS repeat-associated protein